MGEKLISFQAQDNIIDALRTVLDGRHYLSSKMTQRLIGQGKTTGALGKLLARALLEALAVKLPQHQRVQRAHWTTECYRRCMIPSRNPPGPFGGVIGVPSFSFHPHGCRKQTQRTFDSVACFGVIQPRCQSPLRGCDSPRLRGHGAARRSIENPPWLRPAIGWTEPLLTSRSDSTTERAETKELQ
jgi:hypothetical protein